MLLEGETLFKAEKDKNGSGSFLLFISPLQERKKKAPLLSQLRRTLVRCVILTPERGRRVATLTCEKAFSEAKLFFDVTTMLLFFPPFLSYKTKRRSFFTKT